MDCEVPTELCPILGAQDDREARFGLNFPQFLDDAAKVAVAIALICTFRSELKKSPFL